MRGDDLAKLLAYGASRTGSDSFTIVEGVTKPESSRMYKVATTDYMARTASGYRDFFKNANSAGKRVRDEVAKALH